MFPAHRAGNHALRQRLRTGFGQLDHAVTRAPQRGVQAENDLMGFGAGRRGPLEYRPGRAPRTAKALLHLPELLWGDAHQRHSASRRPAAKAENGAGGAYRPFLSDEE